MFLASSYNRDRHPADVKQMTSGTNCRTILHLQKKNGRRNASIFGRPTNGWITETVQFPLRQQQLLLRRIDNTGSKVWSTPFQRWHRDPVLYHINMCSNAYDLTPWCLPCHDSVCVTNYSKTISGASNLYLARLVHRYSNQSQTFTQINDVMKS